MLDPRRKNGLGGSDLAILMGACPPSWGNARTIWMDKKGLLVKEETEDMHRGKLLEPIICSEFERHYAIEHCHAFISMHTNSFHMCDNLPIVGTLDFLGDCGHLVGAEFKSTTVTDDWGDPETGEVPLRVEIQCNTYMMLAGLDEWEIFVAFLSHGLTFSHYHIKRNNALIDKIKMTAVSFWDTYMDQDDPPSDEPCAPIVCLDSPAQVSDDLQLAMSEAIRLKGLIGELGEQADPLTKQYDLRVEEIKGLLGDSRYAKTNGWKADWNRKPQKKPDYEAMYRALKAKYELGELEPGETRTKFVSALEREHTKNSMWQRFTLAPIKGE